MRCVRSIILAPYTFAYTKEAGMEKGLPIVSGRMLKFLKERPDYAATMLTHPDPVIVTLAKRALKEGPP